MKSDPKLNIGRSILYLTYDGLSDQLGQSQILPYVEGLSKLGHKITVVSFEKDKGNLPSIPRLIGENDKIEFIPIKYHKSPPVLSTLFDIYLLKKAVKRVIKSQQIDIIHCRSYITALVGQWAKRKYRISFVFDMRGFWADERVEGGLWNRTNPLFNAVYNYFKRKELEFITESDTVISLTNNAKKEMLQWKKAELSPDKVHVIPTCVNLKLFDPKSIASDTAVNTRAGLGLGKDEFVLLYLGSLGTWYMLDEMLKFFKELKAEKSKRQISCKFLFLTRDKQIISDLAVQNDLSAKDIIITHSDRINVPTYISICDAGIFFILPTFSKKASAATKMGEIMAMGKPVITNTEWGDVDAILENSGNGVVVKSLNVAGYRQAINSMDMIQFDPESIRQSGEQHFSLDKGIQAYHEIYLQQKGNWV